MFAVTLPLGEVRYVGGKKTITGHNLNRTTRNH
jgi:hypothetical protein